MNTATTTSLGQESANTIMAKMAIATGAHTGPDITDEAPDWDVQDMEYLGDASDFFDEDEALGEPLPTLDQEHVDLLLLERISADVAAEHGVRTVRRKMDLPPELRSVWDGKGILFANHKLDGTIVPQYRPDVATILRKGAKDITKYWLPKGSGSSPYISPKQKHLIGRCRSVYLIEGTKAFLAMLSLLEASGRINDILLVGIAGCTGGRKDGKYDQAFMKMIERGARVTVFLDADLETNPNVNLMAVQLQKYLKLSCGADARFASLPVFAKNGVSDWLGSMPDIDDRAAMAAVEGVADEALVKIPRVPMAARKNISIADSSTSVSGYKVSWQDECISKPYLDEKGQEHLGEKIMDRGAVRLAALYEVWNDKSKRAIKMPYVDIEFKIGGQKYLLEKLPETYINEIRKMLSMLPGGVGSNVSLVPRMGEFIGEAIRVSAGRPGVDFPVRRTLTRMGWFESQEMTALGLQVTVPRYIATNGAIGPDDMTTDLTGQIAEATMSEFEVLDPHALDDRDHIEAIRETLRVSDELLIDPRPWIVGHGLMAMQACGVTNLGVFVIAGGQGSGKTTQAQALFAMQTGVWTERLANFEGTANFVSDVGHGVEHGTVFVDDLRGRGDDVKSGAEQKKAYSQLMRRGYGGSAYSKGRKGFNAMTNQLEQGEKDSANPLFIMTAEPVAIPDGIDKAGNVNSDNTRAQFITVSKETTFRPGGAAELQEIAESQALHVAHVGFIADLAKTKAVNTHEVHVRALKDSAQVHRGLIEEKFPGLPPRSYELAANALVGYKEFLDYAETRGAITPADNIRRSEQALNIVGEVAHHSWNQYQGGSKQRETPLGKLVAAVLTGRYYIAGINPRGEMPAAGAKMLGKTGKLSDGTEVIHVLRPEACEITGLTDNILGPVLSDVLHPADGYTRQVRFGAMGQVRVYTIDRSAWSGEDWKVTETAEDEGTVF